MRSNNAGLFKTMRYASIHKVIDIFVAITFLFSIVGQDAAWAAKAPIEPARVGTDRTGGSSTPLDPANVSVPLRFGDIREAFKGSNGRTIIHIQDAHCNYAAQSSIEAIIEHLTDNYDNVNLLSLEGGKGNYDLSIFTNIRDPETRMKVSDFFVKEGRVSGPEFFAINNPDKVELFGIEDERLYRENLSTYRNSLSYKEEADRWLNTLSNAINNLKMKMYSPRMKELDDRISGYQSGRIDFKDYIVFLADKAKAANIDPNIWKTISSLVSILNDEKAINFKEADRERNKLIDKINERVSKKDLEELVIKSSQFKMGDITSEEFYSYLFNKARFSGVDFSSLPNLVKYSEYMKKYESLDKTGIFKEAKLVEDALFNKDAKTEDQKTLRSLDKDLSIIKGMFSITLMKEEFDYYESNKDSFRMKRFMDFINTKAPLNGLNFKLNDDIIKLDKYRDNMEKFYKYSLKRDNAFIKNIEKKMKDEKKDATILVTGGFHTGNLSKLFKEKGYSYIEVMPKFGKKDGECPYFRLLAGKGSDFDNFLHKALSPPQSAIAIESLFSEMRIDNATPEEMLKIKEKVLEHFMSEAISGRPADEMAPVVVKTAGGYTVIKAGAVAEETSTKDISVTVDDFKLSADFVGPEAPADVLSIAYMIMADGTNISYRAHGAPAADEKIVADMAADMAAPKVQLADQAHKQLLEEDALKTMIIRYVSDRENKREYEDASDEAEHIIREFKTANIDPKFNILLKEPYMVYRYKSFIKFYAGLKKNGIRPESLDHLDLRRRFIADIGKVTVFRADLYDKARFKKEVEQTGITTKFRKNFGNKAEAREARILFTYSIPDLVVATIREDPLPGDDAGGKRSKMFFPVAVVDESQPDIEKAKDRARSNARQIATTYALLNNESHDRYIVVRECEIDRYYLIEQAGGMLHRESAFPSPIDAADNPTKIALLQLENGGFDKIDQNHDVTFEADVTYIPKEQIKKARIYPLYAGMGYQILYEESGIYDFQPKQTKPYEYLDENEQGKVDISGYDAYRKKVTPGREVVKGKDIYDGASSGEMGAAYHDRQFDVFSTAASKPLTAFEKAKSFVFHARYYDEFNVSPKYEYKIRREDYEYIGEKELDIARERLLSDIMTYFNCSENEAIEINQFIQYDIDTIISSYSYIYRPVLRKDVPVPPIVKDVIPATGSSQRAVRKIPPAKQAEPVPSIVKDVTQATGLSGLSQRAVGEIPPAKQAEPDAALKPSAPPAEALRKPPSPVKSRGLSSPSAASTDSLLADQLKSIYKADVVSISPAEEEFPRKLDQALRSGDIVMLNLSGLKLEGRELFGKVWEYFNKRYNDQIGFAVYEMIKNACAHGNGDDLKKPIFIHIYDQGDKMIINVVDTASGGKPAANSPLAGAGRGSDFINRVGVERVSYEEISTELGAKGLIAALKIQASVPGLEGFRLGRSFRYSGKDKGMKPNKTYTVRSLPADLRKGPDETHMLCDIEGKGFYIPLYVLARLKPEDVKFTAEPRISAEIVDWRHADRNKPFNKKRILPGELNLEQLQTLKTQYANIIGFTTSSDRGVSDADKENVRERIREFLAGYSPADTVIVCGLTDVGGVRLVYDVAEEMGFKTAGIVAGVALREERTRIRNVDYTYIEETADGKDFPAPDHKEVTINGGWGSESPHFLRLITQLVAFGGGNQAEAEIAATVKNDKPVTLIIGVHDAKKGALGATDSETIINLVGDRISRFDVNRPIAAVDTALPLPASGVIGKDYNSIGNAMVEALRNVNSGWRLLSDTAKSDEELRNIFKLYVISYRGIGLPFSDNEQGFEKFKAWYDQVFVNYNSSGRAVAFIMTWAKGNPYGVKLGLIGSDGSREGREIVRGALSTMFHVDGVYGELSHRPEEIALGLTEKLLQERVYGSAQGDREAGATEALASGSPVVNPRLGTLLSGEDAEVDIDGVHLIRKLTIDGRGELKKKLIVGNPIIDKVVADKAGGLHVSAGDAFLVGWHYNDVIDRFYRGRVSESEVHKYFMDLIREKDDGGPLSSRPCLARWTAADSGNLIEDGTLREEFFEDWRQQALKMLLIGETMRISIKRSALGRPTKEDIDLAKRALENFENIGKQLIDTPIGDQVKKLMQASNEAGAYSNIFHIDKAMSIDEEKEYYDKQVMPRMEEVVKTNDSAKDLLFDAYIHILRRFIESNKIEWANEYLEKAKRRADELRYDEAHPLQQTLRAFETYYLLVKSWQGGTGGSDAKNRLDSILTEEFLKTLAGRTYMRYLWLMDLDIYVQNLWRRCDFNIEGEALRMSVNSMGQALDWFDNALLSGGLKSEQMDEDDLLSMFHVFTAYFDMKALTGKSYLELDERLLSLTPRLVELAREASKGTVFAASNLNAMYAYGYHMQAVAERSEAAYTEASKYYRRAVETTDKAPQKVRQHLLMTQLNVDFALAMKNMEYMATAKNLLKELQVAYPDYEALGDMRLNRKAAIFKETTSAMPDFMEAPATAPLLVSGETVVCSAGPEMISASGKDYLVKYIKEPMNKVGELMKLAAYRDMFNKEPCYIFGIGGIPTDQNGAPIAPEELGGSLSGVKGAANSLVMREKLGNVNFVFGNGIDFARDGIRKIISLGIKANRVRCSISSSVLRVLSTDAAFMKELGLSKKKQTVEGLRDLLATKATLLIMDDSRNVDGKIITMTLPFGRIGLEGLARLNLEHFIERERDINAAKNSSYIAAVKTWARSMGLLTNNDKVADEIEALATDEANGLAFISKTFEVVLPRIVAIDAQSIVNGLKAEIEVLRAL